MEFLKDSSTNVQPKDSNKIAVTSIPVKNFSPQIITANYIIVPGNKEVVKRGYTKNEPDYINSSNQIDWAEILSNKNFALSLALAPMDVPFNVSDA